MPHRITQFALLVRDHDEAIAFYTHALGFALIEDSTLPTGKRWVRVAPESGPAMLLALATTPEQIARIGDQTGGRVLFYLETDDIQRDYLAMRARGVTFDEPPRTEDYGSVAVLRDLYNNRIDLIQPSEAH